MRALWIKVMLVPAAMVEGRCYHDCRMVCEPGFPLAGLWAAEQRTRDVWEGPRKVHAGSLPTCFLGSLRGAAEREEELSWLS